MSTKFYMAERARSENWIPVLQFSAREVFEKMLGSTLETTTSSAQGNAREYTAMIGLAGCLCGLLTVSCSARTAYEIAARMLGPDSARADEHICDALGEICNMIAGNMKNKLSDADGTCWLSIPTVITGERCGFHAVCDGESFETTMRFGSSDLVIRLELHG